MKNFDDDFKDFQSTNDYAPGEKLDKLVLNYIKNDLNPKHQKIFLKLCLIHGFIGFLTLIFCPQFQLSLTNNAEVFHYFHHHFGENICMLICGSIFIGSGALFAAYILSPIEISKIRKSRFLYYSAISSLAFSFFLIFGTQTYLILSLFWFIGATLSGIALMELNTLLRLKLFN